MAERLLDVEGITVDIDGVPVLDDLSLSVDAGETVGLVGRNGAGKTTTFRSVMGQANIREGTVSMRGVDITDASPKARPGHGLGFAPEDRRLFTTLSVVDNLRMATWGKGGIDEAGFQERVDLVQDIFPEMTEFMDRPAGNLSGGQQKMVTVGRALAADPDLILIDEPFEGLAPSVRERFREGIERIQEMDVSVLLAESNVRHAEEVAERFYVIERGEIVDSVSRDERLTEHPSVKRIFEGG
ncbi:ABC transporter ATP-binding protein [Natronobeatus ordinarius]|uniref:ABC transporter ATP-binding protein n=1 Tax=Natronobeatus ordinarius TaxID=2963433 RepID=UPI0020CF7CFE|nr:ABC transporter ATP-binding protein [Natronobeatus ordinarius]